MESFTRIHAYFELPDLAVQLSAWTMGLQSFCLCGIPNGTTVYTGLEPDRAMTIRGDKTRSSAKFGILNVASAGAVEHKFSS